MRHQEASWPPTQKAGSCRYPQVPNLSFKREHIHLIPLVLKCGIDYGMLKYSMYYNMV